MDRLSRAETVAGFYGLGLYWGNARSQNAAGHVVRCFCFLKRVSEFHG